jgi:hypothetical protein
MSGLRTSHGLTDRTIRYSGQNYHAPCLYFSLLRNVVQLKDNCEQVRPCNNNKGSYTSFPTAGYKLGLMHVETKDTNGPGVFQALAVYIGKEVLRARAMFEPGLPA